MRQWGGAGGSSEMTTRFSIRLSNRSPFLCETRSVDRSGRPSDSATTARCSYCQPDEFANGCPLPSFTKTYPPFRISFDPIGFVVPLGTSEPIDGDRRNAEEDRYSDKRDSGR